MELWTALVVVERKGLIMSTLRTVMLVMSFWLIVAVMILNLVIQEMITMSRIMMIAMMSVKLTVRLTPMRKGFSHASTNTELEINWLE